jgi:RNA polymerase sigma-70 factor, ECF subfamily
MTDQARPSRQPDPDSELVAAAKAGSFEAFERLVGRYERPIYSLAMRILRHPHDAEEVAQETFLSVLEHLRGFAGQSAFYTWMVRIATNHALKLLRKKRGLPLESLKEDEQAPALPHPDFIAPWRDDPALIAQRHEIRPLLDQAMCELEEKHRLVFILRDVEGFSTAEAAELLGISVANAKVRLLRARLMLREKLTRALGDSSRRIEAAHDHG